MLCEIKMPAISLQVRAVTLTMSAGYVMEWYVKPGDLVKKGMLIAQIEEEKAVSGVETPVNGRVVGVYVEPGQLVCSGDVICVIESGL